MDFDTISARCVCPVARGHSGVFMIDDVSRTAAQVKQCNPSRIYKGERGDGRERAEQRRRSRD